MRPNIFVSSTIQDLQYLREAIRDTILSLGYNPVMSEFGDIGYLPALSVEDACYLSLKDCQIANFNSREKVRKYFSKRSKYNP